MIRVSKKEEERKDGVMKVIIKGGSEDTNTYYYPLDQQYSSTLTNESVMSDLTKLMQLESYEFRKNKAQISQLEAEVHHNKQVLDNVLTLCDDETKTSTEILTQIHKYLAQL